MCADPTPPRATSKDGREIQRAHLRAKSITTGDVQLLLRHAPAKLRLTWIKTGNKLMKHVRGGSLPPLWHHYTFFLWPTTLQPRVKSCRTAVVGMLGDEPHRPPPLKRVQLHAPLAMMPMLYFSPQPYAVLVRNDNTSDLLLICSITCRRRFASAQPNIAAATMVGNGWVG